MGGSVIGSLIVSDLEISIASPNLFLFNFSSIQQQLSNMIMQRKTVKFALRYFTQNVYFTHSVYYQILHAVCNFRQNGGPGGPGGPDGNATF